MSLSKNIIIGILTPTMLFSNPMLPNTKILADIKKKDIVNILKTKPELSLNKNFFDEPEINKMNIDEIRSSLLQKLNDIRLLNGLKPFVIDSSCNVVAQKYSHYLYKNNMDKEITFEDHYDLEGKNVYDRMEEEGLVSEFLEVNVGEILISTRKRSMSNAVDSWMNSMPHKNEILGKYDRIGIGHEEESNNIVVVFISN